MTARPAVALALVLAAGAAAAAGQPRDDAPAVWKFRKPIVLPALSGSAFVEVMLDADVYGAAAPDLRDLRVHNQAGAEVGYLLRRHEQPPSRQTRDVPLRDPVTVAGEQTRVSLDLGPRPALHNRVRLTVADDARNFRVPVRVETSSDGRSWQLARAGGFIYVVEGESRAADTSVSYPTSTARWLRVTVGPAHGRALPVNGAAVGFETPAERHQDPLASTLIEQAEDSTRKTTVLW